MNAWLRRLSSRQPDPAPTGQTEPRPPNPLSDEEIPRYPPFVKGLPLPPLPQLMATQSELIARLRKELMLGDDDDGTNRWESYLVPVLERYAAFVHLIPASEAHHHRGAGGLYRHGLEAAFHATRSSKGVMIGLDRPRVERRQLEPRLRVAAALGGLFHDAGKVIHDVTATDRDGRSSWSPIDQDLDDWAKQRGLDRYFLHWREQRAQGGHEAFNLIALKRILPARVERWLSHPDPNLYSGFLAAITGVPHSSPLVELVRKADRVSVEQDLREHRLESIDTAVGVPVDRYLIDAMRRLLHDGRWTVNVPGARVWLFADLGLHLVWPAAAKDMSELLAKDRVPGIPRDPDTIAELLLERNLAVPRIDALGQHPTWRMAPAVLSGGNEKPVELAMLRLKDPGVLFPFGAPGTVELWSAPEVVSQPARSEPRRPSEPLVASQDAPSGQPASKPASVGTTVPLASEPSVVSAAGKPSEPSPAFSPNPSAAAIEQARRWLTESSTSTARFAQAIDSLDRDLHTHTLWRDGLLWLRYPDWFETAGWPAPEAAQALSEDGWLETDPQTPMRRVRDHAGQRWLALQAGVSDRLHVLFGEAAQTDIHPLASAELPQASSPPPQTQPDGESAREPAEDPHLIETVIRTLTLKYGHGDGAQEQVLDPDTLKTLSKDTQLGIYHLRDRLLTDPRFKQDQQHRLIVTL
ncbi:MULTISPECIES: MobH family relaxase [Thiorhodovibrio]|uniref:MobH family relaxase n=1 Tax=Thiorhodovibrio TaxID=61593 RepID=UPI0019144AB1|nr:MULTISPECIES: MobH family relaxase [Thiorhodovibrio]MBK5969324.1 helicase [Thiorhodovibrio winogradskyi]WPL12277.1 integrating conjugative element relaxase, PFGI-1 class [Thiorhodovibrio litoralis]